MKPSTRFQIGAGLAGSALLIVSVPLAVLLSVPTASAGAALAQATTSRSAVVLTPAQVTMVIVPGIRLGPDKKMHDAFTPTDFSATVGQPVIVTVYNYDTAKHSFTAPALFSSCAFSSGVSLISIICSIPRVPSLQGTPTKRPRRPYSPSR